MCEHLNAERDGLVHVCVCGVTVMKRAAEGRVNFFNREPLRKSAKADVRWRVRLIRSSSMRDLGAVYARDERAAREQAIQEFRVPNALQFKLVVQRAG